MKNYRLNLFLIVSIAVVLGFTKGLTEDRVKQFISLSTSAATEKRIEFFQKHLADNVSVTVTIKMMGKKTELNLNRDQYLQGLQQTFASSTEYKQAVSNLKVNLIDKETSECSYDVFESIKTAEGELLGKGTGKIRIILNKKNEIKITKQSGNMTMTLVEE